MRIKISLGVKISVILYLFKRFHDKSTISFGICLPAVCLVDNLEYVINKVIQGKFDDDIIVEIPKQSCQFEENRSEFNTIDWITM